MRARSWSVFVGLTGTLVLAGCGDLNKFPFSGLGSGSSGPSPTTQNLPSNATLDGMVFSNGTVVNLGGGPFTGDNDLAINGVSTRQFFSFDLATVPAGAVLSEARVYLRQAAVRGTPYTSLGSLLLEPVDYGASLDAGDLGLPPLPIASTLLSSTATIEWKSLDVLAPLIAARAAGRTRLQVRLRFSGLDSDADGGNDAVEVGDAESSAHASSAPYLLVTYTDP